MIAVVKAAYWRWKLRHAATVGDHVLVWAGAFGGRSGAVRDILDEAGERRCLVKMDGMGEVEIWYPSHELLVTRKVAL